MAPKLILFPAFSIFLIACLSLFARASPVPHAMASESENLILLRDFLEREPTRVIGGGTY